ncbi:GNAT family N-acetyltransferase [Parasulfitobacter algicola]|uniref:GNAT family N-acetyltransferase n=1 Tax=Parasulfitobacter algicola TaxID=2614809 RepID=A0ABX2IUP8_9RHOB|nr:GNAT family N-acetyltransferase [Sulfitobacter algicola]NSX54562.1 GNAT family N-acetyltransferase [Sulfitobacter algicola]
MKLLHYFRNLKAPVAAEIPTIDAIIDDHKVQLRQAKAADAPIATAMFQRAFVEERAVRLSDDISPDLAANVEQAQDYSNSTVILVDDQIVGFSYFMIAGNDMRRAREMLIKYIYIVPEHRSIHLIKLAMDQLEGVARNTGCARLYWGFDTGKDLKRKRSLARFLGFKHIDDTLFLSLKDQQQSNDAQSDLQSLSRRTYTAYRRVYDGLFFEFLILSILSFFVFRSKAKSGMKFFETRQNGYLFAFLSKNFEENLIFCHVNHCYRPTKDNVDDLIQWGLGNNCKYILVDTQPVAPLDTESKNDLIESGFEVLGANFYKII